MNVLEGQHIFRKVVKLYIYFYTKYMIPDDIESGMGLANVFYILDLDLVYSKIIPKESTASQACFLHNTVYRVPLWLMQHFGLRTLEGIQQF